MTASPFSKPFSFDPSAPLPAPPSPPLTPFPGLRHDHTPLALFGSPQVRELTVEEPVDPRHAQYPVTIDCMLTLSDVFANSTSCPTPVQREDHRGIRLSPYGFPACWLASPCLSARRLTVRTCTARTSSDGCSEVLMIDTITNQIESLPTSVSDVLVSKDEATEWLVLRNKAVLQCYTLRPKRVRVLRENVNDVTFMQWVTTCPEDGSGTIALVSGRVPSIFLWTLVDPAHFHRDDLQFMEHETKLRVYGFPPPATLPDAPPTPVHVQESAFEAAHRAAHGTEALFPTPPTWDVPRTPLYATAYESRLSIGPRFSFDDSMRIQYVTLSPCGNLLLVYAGDRRGGDGVAQLSLVHQKHNIALRTLAQAACFARVYSPKHGLHDKISVFCYITTSSDSPTSSPSSGSDSPFFFEEHDLRFCSIETAAVVRKTGAHVSRPFPFSTSDHVAALHPDNTHGLVYAVSSMLKVLAFDVRTAECIFRIWLRETVPRCKFLFDKNGRLPEGHYADVIVDAGGVIDELPVRHIRSVAWPSGGILVLDSSGDLLRMRLRQDRILRYLHHPALPQLHPIALRLAQQVHLPHCQEVAQAMFDQMTEPKQQLALLFNSKSHIALRHSHEVLPRVIIRGSTNQSERRELEQYYLLSILAKQRLTKLELVYFFAPERERSAAHCTIVEQCIVKHDYLSYQYLAEDLAKYSLPTAMNVYRLSGFSHAVLHVRMTGELAQFRSITEFVQLLLLARPNMLPRVRSPLLCGLPDVALHADLDPERIVLARNAVHRIFFEAAEACRRIPPDEPELDLDFLDIRIKPMRKRDNALLVVIRSALALWPGEDGLLLATALCQFRPAAASALHGFTPLHIAAQLRQPDLVKPLLDRGAIVDVHTRDESGATPLIVAARSNAPAVIELLLPHSDIHATDDGGSNAVIMAIHRRAVSAFRVLLCAGADPPAQLLLDQTPCVGARLAVEHRSLLGPAPGAGTWILDAAPQAMGNPTIGRKTARASYFMRHPPLLQPKRRRLGRHVPITPGKPQITVKLDASRPVRAILESVWDKDNDNDADDDDSSPLLLQLPANPAPRLARDDALFDPLNPLPKKEYQTLDEPAAVPPTQAPPPTDQPIGVIRWTDPSTGSCVLVRPKDDLWPRHSFPAGSISEHLLLCRHSGQLSTSTRIVEVSQAFHEQAPELVEEAQHWHHLVYSSKPRDLSGRLPGQTDATPPFTLAAVHNCLKPIFPPIAANWRKHQARAIVHQRFCLARLESIREFYLRATSPDSPPEVPPRVLAPVDLPDDFESRPDLECVSTEPEDLNPLMSARMDKSKSSKKKKKGSGKSKSKSKTPADPDLRNLGLPKPQDAGSHHPPVVIATKPNIFPEGDSPTLTWFVQRSATEYWAASENFADDIEELAEAHAAVVAQERLCTQHLHAHGMIAEHLLQAADQARAAARELERSLTARMVWSVVCLYKWCRFHRRTLYQELRRFYAEKLPEGRPLLELAPCAMPNERSPQLLPNALVLIQRTLSALQPELHAVVRWSNQNTENG